MRILGKEITEGIALTIVGVIFCSVVGGLFFRYRQQIAWFRFMTDTNNVFQLIDRFENSKDPAEKLNTAVKISFHSVKDELAQVSKAMKDLEKGEIGEPLTEEKDPTGREGEVIKKALDYVEWAYSLMDYYTAKIPPEKISVLMSEARAKLIAADFKDDFTDQELAQAFPSFGKLKACTEEDFNNVVKTTSEENVMKYFSAVFAANLYFSGIIGAESRDAVVREALTHAETDEHKKILGAILELQQMRSPVNDEWASKLFFKKSKDWPQVKELVMPFRRAAPHCFQSKNYKTFMDLQKSALNTYRAKNLAERLAAHIKLHGEVPKAIQDIDFVEYDDRHDAWYSEFKFDRTQTEIVISSIGKDRKPGTEDDFVVHRREFIFGGE